MEEKEIKEIIKKHIGGWNVDVMRQSSIDSFAESGRISGGFLIAVKSMMQEYAEHYHKAQQLPTVSDLTKNNILELLNAYKSEVDNFNDAIFIDKFNALAIDILKLSTLTKSAEKPSEEKECETCKNKEKNLVSGLCQCCWATENL